MGYIAYFGQGFANEIPEPEQFGTVKATIEAFREFARAAGRDYYDPYGTASASVYSACGDAEWDSACEFKGIGIPFDYPAFTLAIGRRGGVKRENA